VGNALGWAAPLRFDVIRTGLEYVPRHRRRDLVEHLLGFCGRLVIGVFTEERKMRSTEALVASWRYRIAGRSERPHREPRLEYRVFWIDRERLTPRRAGASNRKRTGPPSCCKPVTGFSRSRRRFGAGAGL